MLLLIFVTIYFFRKFKNLAIEKGEPENKWGFIGAAIYLGVAFGFQFIVGIVLGLSTDVDLEDTALNIIIALLGYGLGALVAYGVHSKWENKPTKAPDITTFGQEEESLN